MGDVPIWKQNGEPRYDVMEFANDDNRISEVGETANMNLVGIIDEEAGGIVGYVLPEFAEKIVRILNQREEAVIHIIFTEEDVRGMAEEGDEEIDFDLAMERAEEWGKHIADTATALCSQQLEDTIRTGDV